MADTSYHYVNPFGSSLQTESGAFYCPDEYRLNLILQTLQPVALRVLLYALANIESDGSVRVQGVEMAKRMRTTRQFVNVALHELVQYSFFARRSRYRFWINPTLARSIRITIG